MRKVCDSAWQFLQRLIEIRVVGSQTQNGSSLNCLSMEIVSSSPYLTSSTTRTRRLSGTSFAVILLY